MEGILAGVRVFDLTIAGAGPLAGRFLAELGAEVIKVEAPGEGDVMRLQPPMQGGWPVGWTHFNRGKKSVILDLRERSDRAVAHALVRQSDVLINNMRPGVADRLGMGYNELIKVNSRLVYGYLSAWGEKGPLAPVPGADQVVQFYSGFVSIQGEEGGSPEMSRFVGHLDAASGVALACGVLQGLVERERTGRGPKIDVSLLHTALATQFTRFTEFAGGQAPRPMGSACATTVPHQAFLCRDKEYLAIGIENERQWAALCSALGCTELITDPSFATNPDRVCHRATLIPRLASIFESQPSNWWQIALDRAGVPHGRFYDWEALRYHTQVRDNDFISVNDIPHHGPIHLVNPPWIVNDQPRRALKAPKPGEHSQEIRDWLIRLPPGQKEHQRDSREAALVGEPLEGLTIVDATSGLCGPYVSRLFCDSGARVIKVEGAEGDPAHAFAPPYRGQESAVFHALNYGKERISINVSSEAGQMALKNLVSTADIFLEDWAVGVAESRGCAADSLHKENPKLIYGAITPFGERGPMRGRAGSELVIQALSNYCSGMGRFGEAPVRVGADIANVNTAMVMFGVLVGALVSRIRTGAGARVSVSQFGTLLYFRGTAWASQSNPDEWGGWGAGTFGSPDYGYRVKDGVIYFFLLRNDPEKFAELLQRLGLQKYLTDERFQHGGRDCVGMGRFAHEVKSIWEAAFATYTTRQLEELLLPFGVLIMPLHNYATLIRDERIKDSNLFEELSDEAGGSFLTLCPMWRFSHATE